MFSTQGWLFVVFVRGMIVNTALIEVVEPKYMDARAVL